MVLVQNWPFFQLLFFQEKQARKMPLTIFQNENTPFQAIKTRSSKTRKFTIILKGLTHGFWTKMAIFATSFFQAKYARKMSFTIFKNEKTPFQAIKTRSSKSRRIDIFLKGLTHGFWKKIAIFCNFFFLREKRPGKFLLRYSRTKKRLSRLKKQVDKKVEKFSKKVLFFTAKQARKMSFMIFQNEKTPLQAKKTRRSKSRKITIILNGLTHGFWTKMAIYATSFFQAKQARKMSLTIFQNEKNAFLGQKNKKFTKSKN